MLKKALSLTLNGLTVLCVAVVAWQVFHRDGAKRSQAKTIQAGTVVSQLASGRNLSSPTVVLALSATCRYCKASAGFYRALSLVGKQRHLRIVVAMREPVESTKPVAAALGIDGLSDIRQMDLAPVGIVSTPTLLIVDKDAIVRKVWVGKLSATQEAEVYRALGLSTSPQHVDGVNAVDLPTLSAADLAAMTRTKPRLVLVDIRDRAAFADAHVSNALNMPYDEITARAAHELPKSERIVVLCENTSSCGTTTDAGNDSQFCSFGQRVLEETAGFSNAVYVPASTKELRAQGVSVIARPGS